MYELTMNERIRAGSIPNDQSQWQNGSGVGGDDKCNIEIAIALRVGPDYYRCAKN